MGMSRKKKKVQVTTEANDRASNYCRDLMTPVLNSVIRILEPMRRPVGPAF